MIISKYNFNYFYAQVVNKNSVNLKNFNDLKQITQTSCSYCNIFGGSSGEGGVGGGSRKTFTLLWQQQ